MSVAHQLRVVGSVREAHGIERGRGRSRSVAVPAQGLHPVIEHDHLFEEGQAFHLDTAEELFIWRCLPKPPDVVQGAGDFVECPHAKNPVSSLAELLEGTTPQRDSLLRFPGIPRNVARPHEDLGEADPDGGFQSLAPQVESAFVVFEALCIRQLTHRTVTSHERRGEGSVMILRLKPVVGELRRELRIVGQIATFQFQRLRDGGVQPLPLAWECVVVDRLPEERMPKSVALADVLRFEDVRRDRFAERVCELIIGEGRCRAQNVIGNRPSGYGGDAKCEPGVAREALGPRQ